MIIDTEFGHFDVSLGDDGTMDTVISVEHELYGTHEIRYGCEYTSEYRDDTGTMTDGGFTELAYDAVDAYCQQYIY